MVDVGGLEPGNYLVGIDDPGMIAGGFGGDVPGTVPTTGTTGTDPRSQIQSRSADEGIIQQEDGTGTQGRIAPFGEGNPAPQQPAPGQPVPGQPAGPNTAPSGTATPAGGTTPSSGGAAPAGSGSGGTNNQQGQLESPREIGVEVPRTVLAQVTDAAPAAGRNDAVRQNQAQVRPPTAGAIRPGQTPAGRTPGAAPAAGQTTNAGTAGPAIAIGTLTVDQSGTGRLQQTVESVRVQDVVGQAIVIYSQNTGPGPATLPPNLDVTNDPQNVPETADPRQATTAPTAVAGADVAPPAGIVGNNRQVIAGSTPVAAGLIRMMNGSGPGAAGAVDTPVTDTVPSVPLPDGPQAVPQNSGVPTNPDEQLR
jgi:hypothetical protein